MSASTRLPQPAGDGPAAARPADPSRRLWLAHAAALSVAACGGGGGAGGGNAAPTTAPAGRLVYANSSAIAVWDFAAGRATVFDPGDVPSLARGVSVSPAGQLALAREFDNDWIGMDVVDLAGRVQQRFRMAHALAFFTSPIMFDATGQRVAFSIDELPDPDGERVTRVLVHRWSDGALLATFDGYDNPEWVAATGELVLRHDDSQALRLVGADLRDRGPLDGLVALGTNGSFSLSRDARYVLLEDGPRIRVHDRAGGRGWIAAERVSNMHAPRLSPDGRFLAFHGIDLASASPQFHTYVPHVVPFAPGLTVAVSDTDPLRPDALAFTGYAMDWLA